MFPSASQNFHKHNRVQPCSKNRLLLEASDNDTTASAKASQDHGNPPNKQTAISSKSNDALINSDDG